MTFMIKNKFYIFFFSICICTLIHAQPINNELIKISDDFSWISIFKGLRGLFILLFIAFILSNNKKEINWKLVGTGIFFQIFLAIGILKGDQIGFNILNRRFDLRFIHIFFDSIGCFFTKILGFSQEGSKFLFGNLLNINSYGFIFAFHVLPTIVFFSAFTSLLFYLGIIQIIVKNLAKIFSSTMKISGIESLAVSGNIFLGQTEAPLMIKTYLDKISPSEIFLVMTAGMATVAGSVLVAYINFLGGDNIILQEFYARHLLTASVMAAPGAIVVAKIIFPQTKPITNNIIVSKQDLGTNILEAISIGTCDGIKLTVNIAGMLLVFITMIALLNYILNMIGCCSGLNRIIQSSTQNRYDNLSLQYLLGSSFSPLMYLIGVKSEDTQLMGQLLGIKLVASEFIAYIELSKLKDIKNIIHFKYEKSVIMATYMLCGFANFASIGIQIGGISSIAPSQRSNLAQYGLKALIAGSLASLISTTISGMFLN